MFTPTDPYDIRIWQCTDFAEHWHSSTELYLCLQGQMDIRIENHMYSLHPDDVVLVAGYEAHEIFCAKPNTRVVLISFGAPLLGSDYKHIRDICLASSFFRLNDIPELSQPLTQIKDTLCRTGSVPKDWIFRGSLYAIASYLAELKHTKPLPTERLLRARQSERLAEVLLYLSKHFHEPITVEQAADIARYDRSYFCKQFRKITGMPFHRYLNCYRISAACRLLTDVTIPLSTVAEQCGFSSQKNLSRLFQDFLGMTPTQYKKLPQEIKNSLRPL